MKHLFYLLFALIFLSCETEVDEVIVNEKIAQKVSSAPKADQIDSVSLDETSSIHVDLSLNFDIQSRIRLININGHDSASVEVKIVEKRSLKPIQTIEISSNFLYWDSTYYSDHVRSYITGKNVNRPVVDNDYGDILVADFNFDGREDLALKRDVGGNGGPIYNFYIQSESQQFEFNQFLTDSLVYFPAEFNSKLKTIRKSVRASAVSVCSTTFTYNPRTQTWRQTKREFFW